MIYQGDSLSCSWLEPGIAEMRFDAQKGSVNKFDRPTINEFRDVVDALKSLSDLKGVIVSSAKDVFIVGADITEFVAMFAAPEQELRQWIQQANAIFNDFEDLPVPTVAAINGIALGGGMEMCLACDIRVAGSNAVMGLPETKLGLIPGFGGTTRLPRVMGVDNALEWIAGATTNKPVAALKIGAIDAETQADKLSEVALVTLKSAIDGKINWRKRRTQKQSALMLNQLDGSMAFATSKAFIFSKAGKNYPAPLAAVDVMEKAANMGRDDALKVEADYFIQLAKTPASQSLIQLFLNDQVLKRNAKVASKTAQKLSKVGVLGAGIMGGGISFQAASKKYAVIMKDIQQESLDLGLNEASKLLAKQVSRGKMNAAKMAKVLSNITPTLHYADVEDVNVVIEAVVENPKVKDAVLQETEGLIGKDAILCSNTSTISINQLARHLQRPQQFCGMHFFNPVHRMPLVEVIRGEQTSDETVATVVAFASSMGKSPIVVNDCPGFFVNRVLFPYFSGFSMLLRDGADFRQIDKIMENFGWPMGPAYLLDVVGMDTGHHANTVMAEGFPDRMSADFKTAIDVMFENKRFGQKTGSGFYKYEADKKGKPIKLQDEKVFELLQPICADSKEFEKQDIINRMMLPMIIETVRCLEENIIASAAEADMGLIYGIGFPPFRGGALKYADAFGLDKLVKAADNFQHLGKMYEPTEGMRKMAENGETFYPKA